VLLRGGSGNLGSGIALEGERGGRGILVSGVNADARVGNRDGGTGVCRSGRSVDWGVCIGCFRAVVLVSCFAVAGTATAAAAVAAFGVVVEAVPGAPSTMGTAPGAGAGACVV
jgi:hypothetical protein